MSHVFWIDDDVIVSRMALLELLSAHVDIVSGVYFTKCDPAEPLIFPGRGCGTTPFVPDRLFKTWGTGMGCTLIRTDVYRRMLRDLPLGLDKYGHPAWYRTTGDDTASFEDGVLWRGGTEDLYMLNEAQKLGFQPWANTSRRAFGWHYDRERRQGYPVEQWAQRLAGKPIVWKTPDGPITWE